MVEVERLLESGVGGLDLLDAVVLREELNAGVIYDLPDDRTLVVPEGLNHDPSHVDEDPASVAEVAPPEGGRGRERDADVLDGIDAATAQTAPVDGGRSGSRDWRRWTGDVEALSRELGLDAYGEDQIVTGPRV